MSLLLQCRVEDAILCIWSACVYCFRMICPDNYFEVIQLNWECLLLPKLHRQRKMYMCRER